MLPFLQGRGSTRKLRLFACAIAGRRPDLLDQMGVWDTLALAERWAEGLVPDDEMDAELGLAGVPLPPWPRSVAAASQWFAQAGVDAEQAERKRQAHAALLRCLFGNPFRPVVVDPAWLAHADGVVAKVAESNYQRRAFDELPLLADALTDCGCVDEQMLSHCRGPGPHARGCFVVDALTGRG